MNTDRNSQIVDPMLTNALMGSQEAREQFGVQSLMQGLFDRRRMRTDLQHSRSPQPQHRPVFSHTVRKKTFIYYLLGMN